MDEILAAGATITIRSQGSEGFRFMSSKYAVGVELHGVRNATTGDDLDEIFARLLEWVKDVHFYHGAQWTPEQLAKLRAARALYSINGSLPLPDNLKGLAG